MMFVPIFEIFESFWEEHHKEMLQMLLLMEVHGTFIATRSDRTVTLTFMYNRMSIVGACVTRSPGNEGHPYIIMTARTRRRMIKEDLLLQ